MKVYGSYTSPFVRHCRIVLLQTGLQHQFIETDAATSANLSPTKKVPLLIDNGVTLTDSSSIIKYLREKSGQPFFADVADFELFNMSNTVLDACVNIFFLELDGIKLAQSHYLQRQHARVLSGLMALNKRTFSHELPLSDGELRLACFLNWGLYRRRIDLSELPVLQHLLALANTDKEFIATAPPAID
ncbi:glutathione S-transferase [Psychromonas sp. MME2]|uniref:glutathione S-transferase family protein n=1 Tax=unclassified Psychromonas TaxID=2614957 RepID=UPI00339BBE75